MLARGCRLWMDEYEQLLRTRIGDENAAKVRQAAQVHNLPVFRMQVGKDASTLAAVPWTGT